MHAGSVELSDALAHWWLLDDDHCGRRHEGTLWNSTGHAAGLFDGELYDQLPQTRGGYSRLHEFGIRFGYERVVLYLEPRVDEDRLEANTPRALGCSWTTSRCRGRAGPRNSRPSCRPNLGSSRNAPRAPTARHAERPSAGGSPPTWRSTV